MVRLWKRDENWNPDTVLQPRFSSLVACFYSPSEFAEIEEENETRLRENISTGANAAESGLSASFSFDTDDSARISGYHVDKIVDWNQSDSLGVHDEDIPLEEGIFASDSYFTLSRPRRRESDR